MEVEKPGDIGLEIGGEEWLEEVRVIFLALKAIRRLRHKATGSQGICTSS